RYAIATWRVELRDSGCCRGLDTDRTYGTLNQLESPDRAGSTLGRHSRPRPPYGTLNQLQSPDRAVSALGGHDRPALRGAVLVDHQVLAAGVQVVRADGDVPACGHDGVGVVDGGERRRFEGVVRVQPQRVQPPPFWPRRR